MISIEYEIGTCLGSNKSNMSFGSVEDTSIAYAFPSRLRAHRSKCLEVRQKYIKSSTIWNP